MKPITLKPIIQFILLIIFIIIMHAFFACNQRIVS